MSQQHCNCEKCRCRCCLCQKIIEQEKLDQLKLEEMLKKMNEKFGTDFDSIKEAGRFGRRDNSDTSELFLLSKTIRIPLKTIEPAPVKFAYPKNGGKFSVTASCEIKVPLDIKGLVADISFHGAETNTCFFMILGTGLSLSSFEEVLELFSSHIIQVAHMKCISANEFDWGAQNGFNLAICTTVPTDITVSITYTNFVHVNEEEEMALAWMKH